MGNVWLSIGEYIRQRLPSFLCMSYLFKVIGVLLLAASFCYAQSFTFSDTYPTNNPDSLEQWLKTHPKPTSERLKNLIRLERTYYWGNLFRLRTHRNEIVKLANTARTAMAAACVNYIDALYYSAQNQTVESVKSANKALNAFQLLGDNSGILHAYSVFVLVNSTIYGNQVVADPRFSKGYLEKIDDLLGKTDSTHDQLMARLAYSRYLYGQGGDAVKELRPLAEKVLTLIETAPDCRYASYRFQRLKAIGYQIQGDTQQSYMTNKAILVGLRPEQEWEIGTMNYNLAVDCYLLQRVEEGIAYCETSISIIASNPKFLFALAGPYTKYRELLTLQGKFEKANQVADSVMKYNSLNFITENDKKMLELEGQYEFERKQAQIAELKTQNQRNLTLLAVSAAVVCLFGMLGYKLYRANQGLKSLTRAREQFFGIIAHDLRRPMHSFHGMSEMVSFYLKKGNYEAIQQLSQAIDESGASIRKMLDNLLSWALSQRGELPYNPVNALVEPRIRSVVELYEKGSPLKEVTFEVHCPGSPTAFVDPNALELIIRNLIDNSYKALPAKGHVAIRVSVPTPRQVHIAVRDNGPGISEEKLRLIKMVFAHPETAQVGQNGMGMGLIMVARFAKQNKAALTVESGVQEGTEFTLRLPEGKKVPG